MFNLNPNSALPINKQLFEAFKKTIIIGAIKENEMLPSVRKIAQELMINPNTVHKVYQQLESEELIISVPQKGVYVNKISDTIKKAYQKEAENDFKKAYINLKELNLEKSYILNLLD